MTHYTVQFNSAITYSRQSGTRTFSRNAWKLAWNASTWVLLAAGSMFGGRQQQTLLREFQTGPRNDVVAVWRVAKWWELSDCSQHASQVWWRLTNSRFVHKEARCGGCHSICCYQTTPRCACALTDRQTADTRVLRVTRDWRNTSVTLR